MDFNSRQGIDFLQLGEQLFRLVAELARLAREIDFEQNRQRFRSLLAAFGNFPRETQTINDLGVWAHYVGDACQPLHISYMFDGDPDDLDPSTNEPRAKGVHSAYESKMLNKHVVDLIEKLNQKLDSGTLPRPAPVQGGHAAAVAVVQLMQNTFKDLEPKDILDAFNEDKDLWELFGDKTIDLMAGGSLALAVLWESAWKESGAENKIAPADRGPVEQSKLSELYLATDFVPSKTLDKIGDLLT